MTILVIAASPDAACDDVLARHPGADVHRLDVAAAGKLLVGLERLRATHAVLTAAQLDALQKHPAFDLADLDALDTVYLVGDPATPNDAAPRFAVEVLSTPAPTRDLSNDAVAHDAERLLAGTDYAAGIAAAEALSHAALRSMLDGLVRAGAFQRPGEALTANEVLERVNAHATQRNLLRRWLRVLTAEGLLRREGDTYRVPAESAAGEMAPDWSQVEHLWRAAGDTTQTLGFARDASAELPALIDGRTQAVHLLFPEGDTRLARAVYRESVAARYQHAAVATCVAQIARRRGGQRLRVLEVGGGTGATTDRVLPLLDGYDVDYLFTDVSRFFTQQVAQHHPGLRTSLYDIDRSADDQGHVPGSFDVVVAGGVLNAARDTDASLRWLASLLADDGWLVISEPTREEYWVMASQAFMLAEPDDERAASQSTFLSHAQWLDALRGAGLEPVVDLPHPDHPLSPLGHRVFAARPAVRT